MERKTEKILLQLLRLKQQQEAQEGSIETRRAVIFKQQKK